MPLDSCSVPTDHHSRRWRDRFVRALRSGLSWAVTVTVVVAALSWPKPLLVGYLGLLVVCGIGAATETGREWWSRRQERRLRRLRLIITADGDGENRADCGEHR